jgi:hypothetical protein
LKDIEKERLPLLRLSTIKRMVEALVYEVRSETKCKYSCMPEVFKNKRLP